MDQLTPGRLLRYAAEAGFIASFDDWHRFRDHRNKTVHSYEEAVAEEVFAILPAFILAAKALLTRLEVAGHADA